VNGYNVVTVGNFENEKSLPQRATLDVMQRALAAADVGPGVLLKKTAKGVEEIS
jgi:hypothetical protein